MVPGNTTASQSLTINAVALNSSDVTLTLDGEDVTVGGLTVIGGTGNDTVTGSGTADTIAGGAGADSLIGGGGADSITGGAGNDVLTGGAGAAFPLRRSRRDDSITDWETSSTNKFVFEADEATNEADLFDAGEVVLANTDPTTTAGTLVTVVAGDYNEGVTGDNFFAADMINVWTTADGATDLGAALNTIDGGGSSVTDADDAILVWYNSTTSLTTLSFITDAGTGAASFADVTATTLATFPDVAAARTCDAFSEASFAVDSLG